jgi:hypothetical protein
MVWFDSTGTAYIHHCVPMSSRGTSGSRVTMPTFACASLKVFEFIAIATWTAPTHDLY